jgi:hypothetical protein
VLVGVESNKEKRQHRREHRGRPPLNALKHVVSAGAGYRADMEAGVTLESVWHLLVANRGIRASGGVEITAERFADQL